MATYSKYSLCLAIDFTLVKNDGVLFVTPVVVADFVGASFGSMVVSLSCATAGIVVTTTGSSPGGSVTPTTFTGGPVDDEQFSIETTTTNKTMIVVVVFILTALCSNKSSVLSQLTDPWSKHHLIFLHFSFLSFGDTVL